MPETFNDLFGHSYPIISENPIRVSHDSYEVLNPVFIDEDRPQASNSVLGEKTFPFNIPENFIPLSMSASDSYQSANSETQRVLESARASESLLILGSDLLQDISNPVQPRLEITSSISGRKLSFLTL